MSEWDQICGGLNAIQKIWAPVLYTVETGREATKPVERWEHQFWGGNDETKQEQKGHLQLLSLFRKDCLWMFVQHKGKPSVLRADLRDKVALIYLNF